MVKIAILYTGEARTIETTISHFKQNVLLNENYHVFAVIQSNDTEFHNRLISENIGENLKSLEFYDNNNSEWENIRETQLKKMVISEVWCKELCEEWQNYLINSGSMIEYYQMHLAYKSLEKYENDNNIEYDFVLRIRTDVVIKDSFNFDIILNKNYITNLLYKIKEFFNSETLITDEILYTFMNIFYNEKRLLYDNLNFSNKIISEDFKQLLEIKEENEFIEKLLSYLLKGEYIITMRNNIVYFVNRKLMTSLNKLGITYGDYNLGNNDYWFNAESQLENICAINNIDFFSSCTNLEAMIYNYNHENYYNEDNNLKDDKFSFFIKRY